MIACSLLFQDQEECDWHKEYPNLPVPETYQDHLQFKAFKEAHNLMMREAAECIHEANEIGIEMPEFE